ncbi:22513_t:CDS:2, partial [Dentiscutata erythropus]
SAPADLTAAIETARFWKTEKFITTETDTKDVIAQLINQIAKLKNEIIKVIEMIKIEVKVEV